MTKTIKNNIRHYYNAINKGNAYQKMLAFLMKMYGSIRLKKIISIVLMIILILKLLVFQSCEIKCTLDVRIITLM